VSGLATLLAGRTAPGVWRWQSFLDVPDVRHAVEHAGWTFGYVDGWTRHGKDGFLVAVGEALALPDWYGANLDALRDCLWDVSARTLLLWDGWGTLARDDERTFTALREILTERAAEEPPFAVLLRGEGPDVGVPELDA
jgi:RNAse (barnase) inhibitor barstar